LRKPNAISPLPNKLWSFPGTGCADGLYDSVSFRSRGGTRRDWSGAQDAYGTALGLRRIGCQEALLGSGLGSFLARSYESKDIADYQTEYVVDRQSAEIIVTGASNFLVKIRAFIQSRMADR
jgi:hypothetical protein